MSGGTKFGLTAFALVLGGLVAGFLWLTNVPGQSFSGPVPQLTSTEDQRAKVMAQDIAAIASVPHNLARPAALENAAQHIEGRLRATGLVPVLQHLDGQASLARNIELVIEPANQSAETLVLGAHYDSAYSAPGANDNGSGVAALLALADELAPLSGKSAVRLRLVFFVNEEPPYFKTNRMGSLAYAEALSRKPERIRGMMSLETMGYFDDRPGSQNYPFPLSLRYPDTGNFIAFVALTSSRDFLRQTVGDFRQHARLPSVGGSAPALVQGIDWSDHWSFEQHGIPALMITDTAPFRYPYYHTEQDTPDKVDVRRLSLVVSGLAAMLRDYCR
jgi:Zn-dependent M28 family amino/carboxypeptidase